MSKKAPDPDKYWDEQLARLSHEHPSLTEDLQNFQFKSWDGASIAYSQQLGKRLVAALSNSYDYADSSFIAGLKKALARKRRAEWKMRMNKLVEGAESENSDG